MTLRPAGSRSALLVFPDVDERAVCRSVLQENGWTVNAVSSFETGRMLLHRAPPDVLVVSERLGAFNGLHLAILGRFESPAVITVVIGDGAAEADTRATEAHYLFRPTVATELAGLLRRIRGGAATCRSWRRIFVRGDLFAATDGAAGPLLDVSYGGMRLVIATSGAPPSTSQMELSLVGQGHRVLARPVWHRAVETRTEYGLALHPDSVTNDGTWRRLVDRFRNGALT